MRPESQSLKQPKGLLRAFFLSQEFLKITTSFVLTTLVGGTLVLSYQWFASRRAEREQLRIAEIQAATGVFNDVSRLLDKRLYRTRRLLWAYADKLSEEETQTRRRVYLEAIQEWNESLNRNYAQTERYFGIAMRQFLEDRIAKEFRCVSDLLTPKNNDLRALEKAVDSLNPEIYDFNVRMLRRLQTGRVGLLADGNDEDLIRVQSRQAICGDSRITAPATPNAGEKK